MFHFPIRCKRLLGCCWRARCSTCRSSSTRPSPPRALRPRPQPCVHRRLPRRTLLGDCPFDCCLRFWQRLPSSRENSTANQSQLVWRPVENLLKLPTQPVENLLSLLKLPTNQLKTIEPVENLNWNCKCSLLNICWARGKLVEKGGAAQMIENWKPASRSAENLLKTLLQSHTRVSSHISKKGKSPLLHFWCYS